MIVEFFCKNTLNMLNLIQYMHPTFTQPYHFNHGMNQADANLGVCVLVYNWNPV